MTGVYAAKDLLKIHYYPSRLEISDFNRRQKNMRMDCRLFHTVLVKKESLFCVEPLRFNKLFVYDVDESKPSQNSHASQVKKFNSKRYKTSTRLPKSTEVKNKTGKARQHTHYVIVSCKKK